MKTLYLMRHAKSSWDNPDLDDFDRPLNSRGERDAPRMGKKLKEKKVLLDACYSSSALRAFTTAKMVATKLNFAASKIESDKKLYHADEDTLLEFIQEVSDKNDCIIVTGHNPGLTDFANLLQKEEIENIPTAGVVAIKLDVSSWKEVCEKSGILLFFDYPKR